MNQATSIVQIALDMQANHTKLQLVEMARSFGWRGDHARAPMLQIAIYVATKIAASGEQFQPESDRQEESGKGEQPEQQQDDDQPEQQGQQDDGQPEQQGQQDDGQQDDGQQDDDQPEQQDDGQPEQQDEQQDDGQQDDGQQDDGQQDQQDDGQQDQQGQQDDGQQDEQQDQDNDGEFEALLKASGIVNPHRMLEKVWRLTTKAKLNVMMVGPSGSGKTMLAHQLAQLVRFPFSSSSCTMGMSESQLTGWLLPVGEAGKFDYVPSPMVNCLQEPSVYLLDEIDAADPNVLMMTNSLLSNGFLTIPHKLNNPTIRRHADSIFIAGANTTGSGADDTYSARVALDGATVDRFYTMLVEYDEAYEHGLFMLDGKKSRKKSPKWERGGAVDQEVLTGLRDWFFALRQSASRAGFNRIVSPRMAQKLVAAVKAGIPTNEAIDDILLTWTPDEIQRVKGV